ncbi:hypothetical protein F5Y06DRAFT_274393 [Hypoxylon sp. FL0890]|nr:hypothetical protein F5Y06DRAFT_274393 [Hypoxylon sp. FL0890]
MASTPTKPTNSQADGAKIQLNQREIQVIAKAWLCITSVKDGIPQVNSHKLCQVGNYATANSARHAWVPIEKKLIAMAATIKDDDDSSPAKPRGRPPKKRKNGDAAADIGETPDGTPVKKKSGGGRKSSTKVKTKTKKESDDEGVGFSDDEI